MWLGVQQIGPWASKSMFPYQFTAFFLKVNSWSLEDARFNTKVADTQSRGFFSSQGNVADPVRWNTSKINYSVPNSPSSPWRMWPIRRKSCTEYRDRPESSPWFSWIPANHPIGLHNQTRRSWISQHWSSVQLLYILSNYDMMQIFVKPSTVDWLFCLLHNRINSLLDITIPSSVYLPANITYNILCSHPELKDSRCQSVHNRSSGISPILSVLEGPLPENPITDAMNM